MARRGAAVRRPSLRLWLWLAAAPGARAIYAPTDPGDFILVEYTAVVPGVTESCAGDGCAAVFNCASPPWCARFPRALALPSLVCPPAVPSHLARGRSVCPERCTYTAPREEVPGYTTCQSDAIEAIVRAPPLSLPLSLRIADRPKL